MVENRATAANRQTCLFVSLDGSIGAILPLSEKVYRRLHMLQQCMGTQMAHTAGLNPRAARQSRGARNQSFSLSSHQSSRNMVDGDLVWLYLHLSNTERLDIAKRLGTARQQLTDDIIELQRLFTHF
jgi:cleavage and polyadenylation specificity factor subunit 1